MSNKLKQNSENMISKINISSIEAGSHVTLDSISVLGEDIKTMYSNLRNLYSKRIIVEVEDRVLDFKENLNLYLGLIDFFSYVIEARSINIRKGIDKAKKEGKQIGKEKLKANRLSSVFLENYNSYKAGNLTKVEYARLCSCSRPTLDRWIKCYESVNEN